MNCVLVLPFRTLSLDSCPERTLTYLNQNGVTTNPSLQVMLCGKPPFWGNYNEQLRRTAAVSPCCYLKFCREVHEIITIPSGTYMQEEKIMQKRGTSSLTVILWLWHTPFGWAGWNVRHSQWVTARGSRFRVQRRCKGWKGRCHLTVAENYCTYTNLSQNPTAILLDALIISHTWLNDAFVKHNLILYLKVKNWVYVIQYVIQYVMWGEDITYTSFRNLDRSLPRIGRKWSAVSSERIPSRGAKQPDRWNHGTHVSENQAGKWQCWDACLIIRILIYLRDHMFKFCILAKLIIISWLEWPKIGGFWHLQLLDPAGWSWRMCCGILGSGLGWWIC